MLKNWYRRLLLSYFPIFLLTVSILIFLSFIIINEISRKETAKADRISTGYMMRSMERSVVEIEMDIMRDTETDEAYTTFFNESGPISTAAAYDVVRRLQTLAENNELISSIYLYRSSDERVLTVWGLKEFNDFPDRRFIEQALANPEYQGWSAVRPFTALEGLKPANVISMYKRQPLPFGDQGLLVINVSVYALTQLADEMEEGEISFLDIRDAAGARIYPAPGTESAAEEGKVLTELQSKRLGWTFRSGIRPGQLFAWVSVISYIWVLIGVLVVAVSIVYIILVTRRNYRPIQNMMRRIESLQLREGERMPRDELGLIDHALESLIQQTVDYERRHHENLLIRRRQLFHNMIEGEQTEKTVQECAELGVLPPAAEGLKYAVIVVETKDDHELQEQEQQGHGMQKLAVTNIFQELALQEGLTGWSEWINGRRAGIIVGAKGTQRELAQRMFAFAAACRAWGTQHLRLTMVFGIGPLVSDRMDLHDSYGEAVDALSYMMTAGQNGIVLSEDVPEIRDGQSYKYIQLISETVKLFRLLKEEWHDRLRAMFALAEEEYLQDQEIRSLVNSLLHMLDKELGGMPESLSIPGQVQLAEEWFAEAETVQEVQAAVEEYLNNVSLHYKQAGETSRQQQLMNEMRQYVETHFADPDLSLNHLSDRFEITPKWVSHLFKAELDIKFIDFLVQLRMQKAEELLAGTDQTIQSIATQVGYANSITFGRVFKRIVGVTPGEYRKLKLK